MQNGIVLENGWVLRNCNMPLLSCNTKARGKTSFEPWLPVRVMSKWNLACYCFEYDKWGAMVNLGPCLLLLGNMESYCDSCGNKIALYNVIIVEKRTSIFQTPAEIPIPWEVAIPRTRIESVWWAPDLLFLFIL